MGLSMTGLDAMHQMLHLIENNPDDTLQLALTHKEFLNIVLGLYATDIFFPCLAGDDGVGNEFQAKLLEIAQHQKPSWVIPHAAGSSQADVP